MSISSAVLDIVGDVLERHADLRLEIGGHADSVGPEDYNLDLSQRRAEAVRTYLVQHFKIDPDRLTAAGFGESRPIATNANPTGRTLNRRVEFVVTDRGVGE